MTTRRNPSVLLTLKGEAPDILRWMIKLESIRLEVMRSKSMKNMFPMMTLAMVRS
jgi:hypothetical protein